jgi:tetratricopeptide (TPR) repeat protein
MSPDDLRQRLWETVAFAGEDELVAFCRAHEADIVSNFAAWRVVPEHLRDSRADAEKYVQAMVAVARLFDQRLGRPELLRTLMGGPDNPLVRWHQEIDESRKEMDRLRYRDAAKRLNDLLIDTRNLRGSGADALLPVTYGCLGECYFQSGLAERALAPTQKALDLSRAAGDGEGVVAYLGNLYEINRHLGRKDDAATSAERLAEELTRHGQADQAERYRRQAARVRAGEPKVRVVCDVGGRRLELAEVLAGGPTGQVRFLFERDRLTLRAASALTEGGEAEANHGRFEAALKLFREAAQIDRFAPQPRYQAALTLLYLQRYLEGVAEYEATEALAPGWFHCRSGLGMARRLADGALSHQAFIAWHVLEDGPLPPAEKVRLAEKTLAEAADFAAVHLALAKNLRLTARPREAEAAARRGLAVAAEPDVRTRLLVELAAHLADGDEKRRLLQEAVDLNGNLVAAAMAALVLRFS